MRHKPVLLFLALLSLAGCAGSEGPFRTPWHAEAREGATSGEAAHGADLSLALATNSPVDGDAAPVNRCRGKAREASSRERSICRGQSPGLPPSCVAKSGAYLQPHSAEAAKQVVFATPLSEMADATTAT